MDCLDTGIYTFVCCILVCGSKADVSASACCNLKADMSAAGSYSYSLPSFGVRLESGRVRLSLLLAFGTITEKLYLML